MNVNLKSHKLITILLLPLCLINYQAYAESVEELIHAQEELNTSADEKKKELEKKQNKLNQTKDAIAMGKDEYQRTCSLCHGIDANGQGVYAYELKTAPADLTIINSRNNNVFPFSTLYKIIDGRKEIEFHGIRDMPIWGNRYNSENWLYSNSSVLNSETLVRGKIFELLLYLESIQK